MNYIKYYLFKFKNVKFKIIFLNWFALFLATIGSLVTFWVAV
jgi:hypothetical protein